MNRALWSNSGVETASQLRVWRGRDSIIHVHSDGSGELDWVCRYEGITHDQTEPGDKQSNGIAEGFVQISKLGSATVLYQAGLTHVYWNYAFHYHEVAWYISKHEDKPEPSPWYARFGGSEFP